MARQRASRARKAPRDQAVVRLLTVSNVVDVPWPDDGSAELRRVQQSVMALAHVVRNRSRWAGSRGGTRADAQDRRAVDLLGALGLSDADLSALAASPTVQVAMPFTEDAHGWEARILPWEFVLSAATRSRRPGPMAVGRWLIRPDPAPAARYAKVLYVESAPGKLAGDWNFDEERALVRSYAGAKQFVRLGSPTREDLARVIRTLKPDVVHLAGFDIHQGLSLALRDHPGGEAHQVRTDTAAPTRGRDGYVLAGPGGFDAVPVADLVDILVPAGHPPSLVFCNVWNSASRIAPMLVARGVSAAIGFQDAIDDGLAEVFAGSFYRGLASSRDAAAAFDAGWQAVRGQRKPLRGTGIVLWRGGTWDQCRTAAPAGTPANVSSAKPTGRVAALKALTAHEARSLLRISVEPVPHITYGLLHNGRDLFKDFLIRKLDATRACDVQVFVELHTNDGTYPFRQTFAMDERPVLDLSPEIRIALTSNLVRSLNEVLRTSLFVEVKCDGHLVFSRTFPVTLDPVDLWTDTDDARAYLPSFVFPRDRAVAATVRHAEQFNTALRDDPTAGFDGYQALDEDLANPAIDIDRQVQALWYAALYTVPPSYINPPPTYSVAAQRIRTPSEIVGGGFGTCIDLALMMAACLEAVEIAPVIFLLNDHAFPGYWRTDAAREEFLSRIDTAESRGTPATDGEPGASERGGTAWAFGPEVLSAIRRAIANHQLVPIETVGLTARSSLAAAVADATDYFSDTDRFLLMLDVQTAREEAVTPLPLGERLQLG